MPASVSDRLLAWYDRHHRDLPWRAPPGAPAMDPYRVWLSEIMLQQTTVAAVKPYFAAFTARWPTLADLAAAEEDDVLAAWAGLGYYSRARNLVHTARIAAAAGGFPASEAELRKLPGLGTYTAAAIAAIAFGRRAVVVDANVERVVARLFAIAAPLPAARKPIRSAAEAITPEERAGDFAQGMMDLGSAICTSKAPKCLLCPLSADCLAYREGDPARYTVKAEKRNKPLRQGTAFWIEREGRVWLVKREAKGVFGGMRALPGDGWHSRGDGDRAAPIPGDWQDCGTVRHVFTHFALDLHVRAYRGDGVFDGEGGQWWAVDGIDEAGLPTLFHRAARLVLASREGN